MSSPGQSGPQVGQALNGYKFLGGDPKMASSWQPLSGDEYLKSLPSSALSMIPMIKMYSNGDMPVPTGASLRSPQMAQLMEMTSQYDPSFKAEDYATRVATRKDFTSGKSAQNITSFNTVLQHLGKLKADADALNNHDFTPLNAAGNTVEPFFGDPRVGNFNTDKTAVTSELVRAFRGTGGAEQDIKDWASSFDPNGSPAQINGAIQRGVQLLKGRMEALADQYQRGMGRARDPMTFLSPEAMSTFQALSTTGDRNAQVQPQQPQANGGWSNFRVHSP